MLGDMPVFGNLFRSETRSRKKTNLMVFLRPVVVRDAAQTDALSLDRYDLMRGKQEAAQPVPSVGGAGQRRARCCRRLRHRSRRASPRHRAPCPAPAPARAQLR